MKAVIPNVAVEKAATDRELLELAAKAIGNEFHSGHITVHGQQHEWVEWSPLTDDGDALRLAVKLGLNLEFGVAAKHVYAVRDETAVYQDTGDGDDMTDATRRAIVRAAAEIGRVAA